MRRPSCRNLGKRAQAGGREKGRDGAQGHDATRLSASRLLIRGDVDLHWPASRRSDMG